MDTTAIHSQPVHSSTDAGTGYDFDHLLTQFVARARESDVETASALHARAYAALGQVEPRLAERIEAAMANICTAVAGVRRTSSPEFNALGAHLAGRRGLLDYLEDLHDGLKDLEWCRSVLALTPTSLADPSLGHQDQTHTGSGYGGREPPHPRSEITAAATALLDALFPPEPCLAPLSPQQEKILAALRGRCRTAKELIEDLGLDCSESAVHKRIQSLRRQRPNLIANRRGAGYYRLDDPPADP